MATKNLSTQVLTYKYRLLPTKRQHAALSAILESQRLLYNAALEERIGCYRKTGATRTYVDQCAAVAEWRRLDSGAASVPSRIQRWTLRRVDDAYKAFFRRLKDRNGRAGFPRFRGKGRWDSFGFSDWCGIRLDGGRLRFAGMPGGLRVHLHRPLPEGKPLACVFRRDAKGWHVCFQVRVTRTEAQEPQTAVGVDVGLSALATLSTGEKIPNPRHARRAAKELRRRQRALSRCRRGSNRRRKICQEVARWYHKVANTRSTRLHQVSADLVSRYDLIAVEKLNVKGMVRSNLARSIHDASWGQLRQMLAYKVEKTGGQLIEVDPRNTSQACSGCGVIVAKSLSDRQHDCPDCGLSLDRDHNAALNILHRAVAGPGALNVAECGERAPGNLALCETLPERSSGPNK